MQTLVIQVIGESADLFLKPTKGLCDQQKDLVSSRCVSFKYGKRSILSSRQNVCCGNGLNGKRIRAGFFQLNDLEQH